MVDSKDDCSCRSSNVLEGDTVIEPCSEVSFDATQSLVTAAASIDDYAQLVQLWQKSGINWKDVDTVEKFERFLKRNPGLSSVCLLDQKVVGVVLCGEDGLRGHIYHVAVDREYRRCGVGSLLVSRSLNLLSALGITSCRLFVANSNYNGEAFWNSLGWIKRDDAFSMSFFFDSPDGDTCVVDSKE